MAERRACQNVVAAYDLNGRLYCLTSYADAVDLAAPRSPEIDWFPASQLPFADRQGVWLGMWGHFWAPHRYRSNCVDGPSVRLYLDIL